MVRIHEWDTTVSHAQCTVNGVGEPGGYGKSQTRWLVHTTDCGTLAITVGNPGYPYSGGKKLAEQLSISGVYRLTLHGWGDRRDIVAAESAG